MPPRFAYWTILIDNTPTAFRARDRQELLPTLTQLKRTNQNVEMKWFAQGQLWDSPEAQRQAGRRPKYAGEKRSKDWRPGGAHTDPRARFDREAQRRKKREQRTERAQMSTPPPSDRRPWREKSGGPPTRERRPWRDNPAGAAPRSDRPWQTKPTGPRAERKPWQHKPAGARPRSDRPSSNKPPGGAAPTSGSRRRRRDDEPPDRD